MASTGRSAGRIGASVRLCRLRSVGTDADRRSGIAERQVQRERAAHPGRAAQLDLAPEQTRELAADRQAESGAAVLAAGARVRLLERFEDDALLVVRDADPGVRHFEGRDRRGRRQCRVIRRPAAADRGDVQPHAALRRELEGVGEQVGEDLLQPLRVGRDDAAQARVDLDFEREVATVRFVPERARDHVEQRAEEDVLRVDGDRPRFDLREIEDVADQIQQVGAGAVNRPRELHLPAGEIAVRVFRQLLAENENAVERGPELVRHVGEELGLVLRRQRELGRLFLDRPPRLLDFLVLAFDLDVLLRQLLRLLRQLLVRLLQLSLLRLQLAGELLRLHQQALGLHRRFDRIEDDADAGGELIQEGQMGAGERAQRGQLDDRLDLAFEEDRQDDHVLGRGAEQSRSDRYGRGRDLRDQHALFLERALPEQPLADGDVHRMPVLAVVGEAGDALQARQRVGRHLVDDALMRRHQRRQLGQQQPADRGEVALALQHVREAREVRLQPVLLRVAIGRQPEVADHRVDVVLELGDLAARVDLNRPGEVAFRDGRRDLGNRADLRRQVGGEQVHVAGQVLPRAGRAGHVGLPAEPAFDADFARDGRDLVGERRQRLRHAVDRRRQRGHFALGLDREVLFQVAVGDGGHDLDDAAHLLGQVGGHHVHVVGQVLPGAGDAGHLGLAAEAAFGADLARHARDFAGERVQLVDHRVERVLELEDLALDVDRDLARQVAARDGGRDLGDVADLRRQVRAPAG